MTEPQQWHPILTTSPGYREAEEKRDLARSLRDQAEEQEREASRAYQEELGAYKAEEARQKARGVLLSDPEPTPPRDRSERTRGLTHELRRAEEFLSRDSFDPEMVKPALGERERDLREFTLRFVEPLRPVLAEIGQLQRTAAHVEAADGGRLRVNPPGSLAALIQWAESGASLVDAPDPFDVESASFEEGGPMTRNEAKRALHGGSGDAWSGRR